MMLPDTIADDLSPLQIQQQIAHLGRLLRDVSMRYTIAALSDDYPEAERLKAEGHELRFEILRLKQDYWDAVELRAEQAAAVEEAERIVREAVG